MGGGRDGKHGPLGQNGSPSSSGDAAHSYRVWNLKRNFSPRRCPQQCSTCSAPSPSRASFTAPPPGHPTSQIWLTWRDSDCARLGEGMAPNTINRDFAFNPSLASVAWPLNELNGGPSPPYPCNPCVNTAGAPLPPSRTSIPSIQASLLLHCLQPFQLWPRPTSLRRQVGAHLRLQGLRLVRRRRDAARRGRARDAGD